MRQLKIESQRHAGSRAADDIPRTSENLALESAGFKVTVTHQSVTDPGLDGIVLSESPNPGTKVPQGSTVTIVVGQLTGATPPPPPATP